MKKMQSAQPKVRISDGFWTEYIELVRNTVIPYQWEALNDRIPDAEPSHAVKNFKIAAGLEQGGFKGFVFQDSDVAKWLEAVGYCLMSHGDPALEALADGMIDIIEKAQQQDGYLNTYFTLQEKEKRWTNLQECHELYTAGHMMEAAVAYYSATGKRKLLDIMCRFADHIDTVFGPEPHQLHGYDGHQEIELALVKLYRATGEEKYLNLARYFIDERGKEPNFFLAEWESRKGYSHWTKGQVKPPDLKYHQAHKPVREQDAAVGHAVRAVYMYTAMADLAGMTGDAGLLEACRRLWDNIVQKQMYITGGIGATHHGEAFTFDYDLPNDTVYAESCASAGLIFFAQRMLQIEQTGTYADVMERALYNIILGSMSRDGRHFFYVNPLEVWPEACEGNPGKSHVRPVRQKWFGCACCPPNIARLLASLGQYVYSVIDDTIFVHLYVNSDIAMEIDGEALRLYQQSDYPWDGRVKFKVKGFREKEFSLALRIPGWCRKWSVRINDEPMEAAGNLKNGYLRINRLWTQKDQIELCLEMPVEVMQCSPRVRENAGRVALMRGPLVYCLEQADNGENLSALSIAAEPGIKLSRLEGLPREAVTIEAEGMRSMDENWNGELYRPFVQEDKPACLTAIPYFLWGNRGRGEMQVWIRRHG